MFNVMIHPVQNVSIYSSLLLNTYLYQELIWKVKSVTVDIFVYDMHHE